VNAERSCPCKQPACQAINNGSEVTFKPPVPRHFRDVKGIVCRQRQICESGEEKKTENKMPIESDCRLKGTQRVKTLGKIITTKN
ncbi:hypothetical protein J6590_098484, partial [Homalodisca vitripennis]